MYGSAWFGSVWGGFLGGISGGIARTVLIKVKIKNGSGAESRPAWTRMVAVVYGSEGRGLGFPSAAQ